MLAGRESVAKKRTGGPLQKSTVRYRKTLSAFGGVGRAPLQALTRRQYSKARTTELDEGLLAALQEVLRFLPLIPPRSIPLLPSGCERCVYIWSDAMWEPVRDGSGEAVQVFDEDTGESFYIAKATLAFVVYVPWLKKWFHAYGDVDIGVIRQMVPGKKTYIGQLEALAATSVIYSVPSDWLQDRDGFMWIDNMGAKYALQKASSRQDDTGRIVHAFWSQAARVRFRPWFEYVPSAQNVADLPSRGKWSEFYAAIGSGSSEELKMVLPGFSTWAEAASAGAERKRKRRGSRGGGRRA